jgi:hypothetical protein
MPGHAANSTPQPTEDRADVRGVACFRSRCPYLSRNSITVARSADSRDTAEKAEKAEKGFHPRKTEVFEAPRPATKSQKAEKGLRPPLRGKGNKRRKGPTVPSPPLRNKRTKRIKRAKRTKRRKRRWLPKGRPATDRRTSAALVDRVKGPRECLPSEHSSWVERGHQS